MLRRLVDLASRASPLTGRIIRESWFTLNGWRFADLKRHAEEQWTRRATSPAAFQHSVAALKARRSAGPRVAFVTNLPPDTTGIASCSFRTWLGSDLPVDIFCPATDEDWFFANEIRLTSDQPDGQRMFDVQAFLTADCLNRYEHIVVATGNSDHCLHIHQLLRKAAELDGIPDRVTLYVHDPVMLNLIQKGLGLGPAELLEMLTRLRAPAGTPSLVADGDAATAHERMADAGLCGARYFANLGVKRFLVNSQAAADILRADLGSADASIQVLFHPVFLPAVAPAWPGRRLRSGPLVVGSFGYAGWSKCTPQIAAAVRHLDAGGHPARLLLAGYGVARFVATHQDVLAGVDIEVRDGPSDAQLCQAMLDADVAVQLRAVNRGESSGVVPQLLALNRPTIVSDIGAFRDYGAAVHLVPPDATPGALAAAILDPGCDDAAMRAYVAARTPERFRAALMQALGFETQRHAPLPVPVAPPSPAASSALIPWP